jgi:hypothetical protein
MKKRDSSRIIEILGAPSHSSEQNASHKPTTIAIDCPSWEIDRDRR